MKVLIINGSPHKNGNTSIALNEMENIFKANDIEVETLHIGNRAIRGCIACKSCFEKGRCVFDDEVNKAAPMFEEADGHTLLRYLTAYHFNAVEWHIVPGTCYEEASLLPVDTSTPEYKAFETKLYAKTLLSMGFQYLLPEQYEKEKSKTEKGDDAR